MVAVLVLSALVSGCGEGSVRDRREDRDPLLRRARDLRNANDFEGAARAFQEALDRNPKLSRAHLELGFLYDDKLKDEIRAIYHYQRYLEMRPDSEKDELVKDLIFHAKLAFATSLPERPSQAVREIAMLQQQVADLQQRLAERTGQPRPAAPQPAPPARSAAAVASPASQSAAPAAAAMENYVVQPGDTLSRIAARVYGDANQWETIYEANRSQLAGPQSIRVGQTLAIPK